MFGYIGDSFWPWYNNSISPSATISLAQNLSERFGASNLRLVNPVDVFYQHNIKSNVSLIKSYVDSLRQYASIVYGRIDALAFPNITAMYNEAYLFVKELDVNGIFFDLAPLLYMRIHQTAFNAIIQNLTDSFPGLNYIMNESANSTTYITPLNGTTWGKFTYVMPTVGPGTYTYSSFQSEGRLSKVVALNEIYPGRVIVHYDANAQQNNSEPMAVFSDQTASNEISAISTFLHNGLNPPTCPSNPVTLCDFNFLVPMFGAWTSAIGVYHGTLYNGFTFGTYHRGTVYNLTDAIANNILVAGPSAPVISGSTVNGFALFTVALSVISFFAAVYYKYPEVAMRIRSKR
jgi:hypothetical protein